MPAQDEPPKVSAVVVPPVSVKLYRCTSRGSGAVLKHQTGPVLVLVPLISSTRQK